MLKFPLNFSYFYGLIIPGILRKRNEDDVESTEEHPLPVDVKNTDESSR